jgi:putative ABC transport system substrate-binding protein
MGAKWFELLKEAAPRTTRVGLIFNPDTAPHSLFLRPMKASAPSFAIELITAPVHNDAEIESAVATFAREPNGGLITMPDIFTSTHRNAIISQATRHRLPAVYPYRYFPAGGGLMSYGVDLVDQYWRSSSYIDRVLRGTNPADMPVQAPIKFDLVINLKTAKALGIELSPTLLARADEVIE